MLAPAVVAMAMLAARATASARAADAFAMHAILLSAEPAKGSTVAGPVITVALTFNERIDAKRSTLALVLPDRSVRPLSLTPQGTPEMLGAHADSVPSGPCHVRWQVLASDGHITRGDVPFTVR
jgi:methionine-rich copper-binding protein CopC